MVDERCALAADDVVQSGHAVRLPARGEVTTHTLLAFVFNTVIVALLVSALVTLAG